MNKSPYNFFRISSTNKPFESINNKYAKYFLLCEMISIISKYELSKLVINVIEINNKKVFTGVAPCHKNEDGTVTATFNEAFIFDLTSNDFSIVVSVYGLYHKSLNKSFMKNIKKTLNINNEKASVKPSYTGVFRNYHLNNNDLCMLASGNVNSPKNNTLTKSISIISNTFNMKKTKKESTKNPMDNIDVTGKEIFIGDYEINYTTQKLDKTTGTYTLRQIPLPTAKKPTNESKYQQNIIIQTGIYLDEKVKQTISYNQSCY